jgi:hypothetical protein
MFDRKFARRLALNGALAALKVIVEMTIAEINKPEAPEPTQPQ